MKRFLLMMFLVAFSLGAASSPPTWAQDPAPARAVVKKFYDWCLKQKDGPIAHMSQVRALFDEDLYGKLQTWYKSGTVDFDPFVNAQVNALGYTIGPVTFEHDFALIPMTLALWRGSTQHLTVVLHRAVDHYEIFNFIYSKDFDLRTVLEKQ